ncbi:hypothetical protein K435DRAFT_871413, partial [Dendrothele bispora CBS 962.96]
MGRQRKWLIERIRNLHGSAKKRINQVEEACSPRKRRKKMQCTEDVQESASDNVPSIHSVPDPPSDPSPVQGPGHTGVFHLSRPPDAPTSAPRQFVEIIKSIPSPFKHTIPKNFNLETPKKPTRSHAQSHVTIEDEDDASLLTRRVPLSDRVEYILISEDEIEEDLNNIPIEPSLAARLRSVVEDLHSSDPPDLHGDAAFFTSFPPDSSGIDVNIPFDGPLPDGRLREAPTVEKATEALQHLLQVMRGESRGKGGGFKDPKFDHFRRHRLEGMRALLSLYTEPRSSTYGKWQASSLNAAISLHHGVYCARVLRTLVRQFIEDHTILPINSYGNWNETLLVDENLVNDINLFLQEIGGEIL